MKHPFRLVATILLAPLAHAQTLYLDVGGGGNVPGIPSAAYGAAALRPGVWNVLDSTPAVDTFVDIAGNATPVAVSLAIVGFGTGLIWADNPLVAGDPAALMEDSFCLGQLRFTGGTVATWTFSNLENGRYDVYCYGMDPLADFALTTFDVEGSPLGPQITGGSFDGTHVLGLSHTRHPVDVTNGTLVITSSNQPVSYGAVNGFQLVKLEGLDSYCFGDGGDQAGCTSCPCGNDAPIGATGGCTNTEGRSAELFAHGRPSVAHDTLRFMVLGMPSLTAGTLFSGVNQLPANPASPCFGLASGIANAGDGLRCQGGSGLRHGVRASDMNGDAGVTTPGWGAPDNPAGGLVAHAGAAAGQTRHFQVISRDDVGAGCFSGIATTQGVSVTFVP